MGEIYENVANVDVFDHDLVSNQEKSNSFEAKENLTFLPANQEKLQDLSTIRWYERRCNQIIRFLK